MRIALIDDGIEPSHLPDGMVACDLSVHEDCVVRARPLEERILTDHGTTCARIIAKYSPQAEFCSLRVFHRERLRTSCDQLVCALSWCLSQRVPLVHLSVGSSLLSDYPRIRPVIARMLRQGQVVVAACSNSVPYSMPARLGGVLGVVGDGSLSGFSYAASYSMGGALLIASSRHVLEQGSGIGATTPVSNSYAAPTVTAAVCNILSQHPPFSMTMPRLYEEMTKDTGPLRFPRPDFIEDAVVLNPGGRPLLRDRFFFNCVAEYASEESWVDSASWSHSLVYIPPRGPSCRSRVPELFFERASSFASLLYCGLLPRDFDSAARGRLIWTEDDLGTTESQDSDAEPPETPVVYILGEGTEAVDVTCRLRDQFVKDEYQCACLCDHPFSYLYGLTQVPSSVPPRVAVADAAKRYDPEVILCCLSSVGHGFSLSEDEYGIVLLRRGSTQAGRLSQNQWGMPFDFREADLDRLYQEICRYFS